jgi:hypothetical protein
MNKHCHSSSSKIAAPLETCTKEEQHSLIRVLTSVKPIEIHRRMKAKYGNACLSQQQVYEWSRKFTNGVTSGDETWVHYHIPETKRAGKVMLILFWDQKCIILEHYTPTGNTSH